MIIPLCVITVSCAAFMTRHALETSMLTPLTPPAPEADREDGAIAFRGIGFILFLGTTNDNMFI